MSATKLSSARTFALTGDVTGTITSDLGSGVSISTTIAANSVSLGTDTTGNYAASVGVSGNGLSLTGVAGEGTDFTVVSNATAINTANTIMFRDETGSYMATNGIHTGAVVAGALNGTPPDDLPVATDLLYGVVKIDGTTIKIDPVTGKIYAIATGGVSSWNDLMDKPANLTALAALAGAGIVRRNSDGTFTLDTSAYLTTITNGMVEAVLTGNVTTHTHSQYLTSITKTMVENVLTGIITSHQHDYLPISGGNLTGALTINGNTIWNSGNDGAGSGLDADLLDGVNSSGYASALQYPSTSTNNFSIKSGIYSTQDGTTDLPTNGVGNSIVHCNWDVNAANQLFLRYDSDYVAFRRKAGNVWQAWKQFAFTDSNVASATKLANTRTIWGQNFNGEGNVSGALSGATTGTFSSTVSATTGIFSNLSANYIPKHTAGGLANSLIYDNGTNVGIGRADPQYKLDVNGSFRSMGNAYVNGVLRNIYEGDPLTGTIVSKSLAYNSSPYGLITRIYSIGTVSLQIQRESNDSETFGLTLQPLGGNVLISTTTDSGYKLDVNGTFRVVGSAYLNSTLSVTGASTLKGLLTANGGINATTGAFSSYVTANRFYTGYDSGIAGSVSCSNWFRSNGATGWFNESYGAGICADTYGIVRTFSDNKLKVYNTTVDSILTLGGVTAANVISSGAVVAGALNGTLPDDLPAATSSLYGVIKTGLSLNNNAGVVNINGRHYTTVSTYTDAAVREITAEIALGTGSMANGTLDQIKLSFAPLTTTRGLTANVIATSTGVGMGLKLSFRKDAGTGRWYIMIYNDSGAAITRDGILLSIRGQQTI